MRPFNVLEHLAEMERRQKELETDPVYVAERERERAEREREQEKQREQQRQETIKRTQIPERLVGIVRGGNLDKTPAVDAIQSPGVITVLSGGVGCGKSVAAAAWLLAVERDWYHCRWLSAAKFARVSRYDSAYMDELFGWKRLVLDDLGTEYLDEKGAYLSLLDELINERHSRSRPLVITTNLPADRFKERYGERIADRIREHGRFVSVDAPSLRRAQS